MAIKPVELFRRGTCQLQVGDSPKERVHCFLNLDTQRLECHMPVGIDFASMYELLDNSFEVTDLELSSPEGTLYAAHVPIAFAASFNGGTMSVAQTDITHFLSTNSRVKSLEFVINEKIIFEINSECHERLFYPGFDLGGRVNLDGTSRIVGAKEHISFIGECDADFKDISIAISIAIGAPVRQFAYFHENTMELFLNNYGSTVKARPMIFTGSIYRDLEKTQTNLREAYLAARSYTEKLESNKRPGMRNAVLSYLEGRVLIGAYELKLLAAFYFLEWFDDTKTLSPNALADRLSIERCEADGICDVRNGLIHNRLDLSDVIDAGLEKIDMSSSERVSMMIQSVPSARFLDYFYSLLGDVLMKEIGYTGQTQHYFPR